MEGDEQTILAKSQTNMECCHVCATYYLGDCNQQNSLLLGSIQTSSPSTSVTRLGDILDFGQLFKALGDN